MRTVTLQQEEFESQLKPFCVAFEHQQFFFVHVLLFPPTCKNELVGFTGDSKLPSGVSVSMHSGSSLGGPLMHIDLSRAYTH